MSYNPEDEEMQEKPENDFARNVTTWKATEKYSDKEDRFYYETEEEYITRDSEKTDEYEYETGEDKEVLADSPDQEDYDEPYIDNLEDLPTQTKGSLGRSLIFDLIFYAVLIFVCIYVIPNYVLQRTVVDGTSMENTLHNGDQLYVEKISYHFNALKRFDIIVFYPYGREDGDYYVKRIIGLPGETVQITGPDIYINGKKLKEHYGKEPITDDGRATDPIKLGSDEYFVLGDNREVSKDSRSIDVGNVKRENIGGRVILRIKPLNQFGPVH